MSYTKNAQNLLIKHTYCDSFRKYEEKPVVGGEGDEPCVLWILSFITSKNEIGLEDKIVDKTPQIIHMLVI